MTNNSIEFRFFTNDKGSPAGKLADAEMIFVAGPLAGMRLMGFAIWQRKHSQGFNVTMPARQYTVNGERRSYALFRPTHDNAAQDGFKELILAAWSEYLLAVADHADAI